MANYPKFMRGKADILGDEELELLMVGTIFVLTKSI